MVSAVDAAGVVGEEIIVVSTHSRGRQPKNLADHGTIMRKKIIVALLNSITAEGHTANEEEEAKEGSMDRG